jgi:ribosomal protein L29
MNKELKEKTTKLSEEELLTKYRSSLIVIKMKSKMGQLLKTDQIKKLKKKVARLLTKNLTKK